MPDPIELTREVVARLTDKHRIVARWREAPEGTESEVALWMDMDGYLRTPFSDAVRYLNGEPGVALVVTAIIDPPAPALTDDEAERARAAGWTPPEEQPTPLPTMPGSVVEYRGALHFLSTGPEAAIGHPWRRVGGDWFVADALQGAHILYDAGTGQAVAR